MTFKAPDSLSEQIADYLAERIIRGELAPGERIQEQKVTQALNVSRGSVREALLILERRHLVAILPRRGAHVTELDERSVRSLCALMGEFYILLGNAVAQNGAPMPTCARSWRSSSACSEPMTSWTSRPSSPTASRSCGRPIRSLTTLSCKTVENLQPAMSRAYYLSLDQRQANMIDYLDLFARLLDAVIARDLPRIREVLTAYGQRSCELVLAALARG